MAVRYLGAPSTSVASEGTFRSAGIMLTDQYGLVVALTADTAELITFVKKTICMKLITIFSSRMIFISETFFYTY